MKKTKLLNRVVSFVIIFTLMFSVSANISAFADEPENQPSGESEEQTIVEQVVEIIENITESYECTADPWRMLDMIIYLGREQAKVNPRPYLSAVNGILDNPVPQLYSLGTAGLVLTALGYDIEAFITDGGTTVNIVELIQNSSGFYNPDGSVEVFGAASALYALNSGSFDVPESIKDIALKIADAQYPRGGWGFDGVNGDVDTTAMCVAALIPYREDAAAKQAIENALAFLSEAQCQSGGYSSFGAENSNTAAMVLIALTCLGIDAGDDARFIKNENSIIDALLTFATQDKKGFGYTDTAYNSFATEQVYRALVCYKKFIDAQKPEAGFSPYDFKNHTGVCADSSGYDANISSLSVDDGELNPGFDPALTEYDFETEKSGIELDITLQNPGAQVTVNEKESLNVTLSPGNNTVSVEVKSENGQAEKTYAVYVYRSGGSGSGSGSAARDINVSITGLNGKAVIAQKTVTLKSGDTPYSVLKRVAAEHDIEVESTGSGSSVYVTGINGLYELAYGPGSGWMFSINGVFHQKSAGVIKLKPGDDLKWIYTRELGDDIGGGYSAGRKQQKEREEEEEEPAYTGTDIEKLIADTAKALPLGSDSSVWTMFAHARLYGGTPGLIGLIKDRLGEYSDGFRKITDIAGLVLAMTAAGLDPTNLDGENLIDKMLDSDRMLSQGLNGPIFVLIALDCGEYAASGNTAWTREKLIEAITGAQNPDGGFSLTEDEDSNTDITAMALCALSGYMKDAAVKAAVDKALGFLSEIQLENGGYKLYNQENCESAAQVIIALSALGIDPFKDERFIKENNLIDVLLSYRQSDNKFSHLPGYDANDMATEQALIALLAYKNLLSGGEHVYNLRKIEGTDYADALDISPWAFEYVIEASRLDLMLGSGGYFKPKDSITRAQLAQMLSRLLKLVAGTETEFSDIAPGAWYAAAVSAVSKAGIMLGASGRFEPDKKLSREELAVVLRRVLDLPEADASVFTDYNKISDWAKSSVGAVSENGIMVGSNGEFRPGAAVSREEAAAIFVRLYQALGEK